MKIPTFDVVRARLARGGYLGLHLTVGFIVSVLALWLFAGVTEDVVNHEPLTVLDLHVATWLRAHSSSALDRIAVAVSYVGSPVTMALLAIVGAAVLAYRKRWITVAAWSFAFVGGAALNWVLKRIIHRVRPVGAQVFLHDRSFAFPSGHAMGSLIGYGMLAYILMTLSTPARRHRIPLLLTSLAVILLVGISRLYLGVHFLSDVIAGYAAGAVWLAVCITGVDVAMRRRGGDPWRPAIKA